MVQSSATSVDEFMTAVEPDRAPALKKLRELCRVTLPGWEERMQWGMPGYGPPGSDALISFNNQKNYISFYPGRGVLELHRGRIKGASFGGGCVRFSKPDNVDFDAIEAMLRHVHEHGRG
jgi:uncharacterized protein YdhG (YjbR/CyaY superfamily)